MLKNLLLFMFVVLGSAGLQSQENLQEEIHLMPWPQEIKRNNSDFPITEDFTVFIKGKHDADSRIFKAATRFIRRMTDKTGVFLENGFANAHDITESDASVIISFGEVSEVAMGIDESYSLSVTESKIEITANTDVGAMHGLSTLLQLIQVKNQKYVLAGVQIQDAPRFVWRGLMMDVARHFMPVEVVKRNIDAMSLVKLNVLHWHLTDDQGFRIESKKLPKLVTLASDGQYYTQHQIKEVVKYAEDRGIRVVPEIDVPGHASAILTAYPELASNKEMTYSIERNAGIFDPTLDPTNEKTYDFLDVLFEEVAPLFLDKYFHIGGDENEGKHWDENPEIAQFKKKHGLKDNHELQTYFNIKLEKILNKYGKSLMGWEEIMTDHMPKTALIHSWRGVNEGMEPGESLVNAVKNGYQTILSNGYYIDLQLSAEEHYLVDPMPNIELTEQQASRILGGEATMWSELVTPFTVDSRIWPRTAAIAERFWSSKGVRDVNSMYIRMNTISQLLELAGIQHISVQEYLLRNISNYQDTDALQKLTTISEPFKVYSRNALGTQYNTFSPYTLFADACTADASEVRPFRKEVETFIATGNDASRKRIMNNLMEWRAIDGSLERLEQQAPLVLRIRPYSKRVNEIASICLQGLKKGRLSKDEYDMLVNLLKTEEDPEVNLDVELAVSTELLDLANHLTSN